MTQRNITYHEPASHKVAEKIQEQGYLISDNWGNTSISHLDDLSDWCLSILKAREGTLTRRFLCFEWEKPLKPIYMADLILQNEYKGAKENSRWVLEVYGRDNIQELTDLVGKIAREESVNLHVELNQERTKIAENYSK